MFVREFLHVKNRELLRGSGPGNLGRIKKVLYKDLIQTSWVFLRAPLKLSMFNEYV